MLGKVIKYEFRSQKKMLFSLFGLALAGAAFFRLLLILVPIVWEPAGIIFSGLSVPFALMLAIVTLLLTFVAVVFRFYQGLMTNEAYLNFVLPVGVNTHLFGRLFVAAIYLFLSGITGVGGFFIMVPNLIETVRSFPLESNIAGRTNYFTLGDMPGSLVASIAGIVFLFFVLAAVTNLLKFYASFAVGTRFGPNRIIGSILGFVILNAIQAVLMLPMLLIPAISILGSSNYDLARYLQGFSDSNLWVSLQNILNFVWVFLLFLGIITLVFSVAHYFIIRHFFGRKLNLE